MINSPRFHGFLLVLAAAASGSLPLQAQKQDPAQWSLAVEQAGAAPGGKFLARLTATIEPGWHLYSPTTPPGPIPTSIELRAESGLASHKVYQPAPVRKFDPNFKSDTETYDNKVDFLIEAELAPDARSGPLELSAHVRYQMCDDRLCLRPVRKTAQAVIQVSPGTAQQSIVIPAGYSLVPAPSSAEPSPAAADSQSALPPKPVQSASQPEGFGRFLLVAFGFGLAAVFTPCVFPMIPITMSFFLNRGQVTRAQSISHALLFCAGIVVLFSGLGLAVTAALGPFGVVQLGSNPWVNAFISLVFFAFGLSLLGAFEITLPSGLLTSLDRASQRGGILGTLLMGLTFSLTAFACVGPFVGTLLAASLQSGGLQPLAGMVSFATGLSLPFFFLALFPSLLARMPRSGGWLSRVKVVLGFIVLAAMFKYLSNVDQVLQWNLLTRERFLAAWVVLLALPGLYLLGLIRLPGVKPEEALGVARTLVASAFLILAVSLLPGMFGAHMGELEAYIPAASRTAVMGGAEAKGQAWLKDDYDGALARARAEGKLLFVNFTGYACTNCHWMKANMFTRPEIAAALSKYVLVDLYTDGADAASRRNQQLQETRFQTVAIPHYAILDSNEKVQASFVGLTKDAAEFLVFLESAARKDIPEQP